MIVPTLAGLFMPESLKGIYDSIGLFGVLFFLAVVLSLVAWVVLQFKLAFEYQRIQPHLPRLKQFAALERQRAEARKEMQILAQQKAKGFPLLAEAYADFFALQDLREADLLETKDRPAPVAAAKLREVAAKRREAERLYRVHRYQLQYYENLFPWLAEYREMDDEDFLQVDPFAPGQFQDLDDAEKLSQVSFPELPAGVEEPDPARHFLTQAEYKKLPRAEKFQRALDHYWKSRKTSWQIGRDYERYIGYLYETDGWDVTYFGIVKGFEDLGRDLLVEKDAETRVIQCKCWASHKTIHEKHIFQLFGTTLEYCLSRGVAGESGKTLLEAPMLPLPVQPVFCTSTSLSDEAKRFAKVLAVVVHEKKLLARYPCIKCNYTKEHGKIYHLPFDQQYDRTRIQDPRTERFVETVAEAEALGYRRAHRWRGQLVTTS